MRAILTLVLVMLAAGPSVSAQTPMKVGMVGLEHGHAGGFLGGGGLTPAGGILSRPDVQLVGIVERDIKLFEQYARQYHLAASLRYDSIAAMVKAEHPQAVFVLTAPNEHRRVVEECAALGLHVMVEKPLATTYADALAIEAAAKRGKIHVLVNLETTWYASNADAYTLLKSGALGPVAKVVIRDGHEGPVKIHVGSEFMAFLGDPVRNGGGALFDFGCYGANLMTWLMDGERPSTVTAVTQQLQPELYPKVDDEAQIVMTYKSAVATAQASWNWPFSFKQMDVYGRTGYAKAMDASRVEVRKAGEAEGAVMAGHALAAPYDDPIHYLEAVLRGEVDEGNSPSALKTNVMVAEILEAARESARTGKTVKLPLGGK
jgi:predicted dehydrogenase